MATTPKELVERLRDALKPFACADLDVSGTAAVGVTAQDIRHAVDMWHEADDYLRVSRPQTVDREAIVLRKALTTIANAEFVDVMCDPGWAIRVAQAALLHPIDDISETGGGV